MPKQKNPTRYFAVTITPKDHVPEEAVITIFETLADRWCFQLEKGKEAEKLHYQGFIYIHARSRETAVAKALLPLNSLVHVRPVANVEGAQMYCLKDDTRVKGPWSDKPIYLGADLAIMRKPLPWQKSFLDILSQKADDRTIHWIVNEKGNVGKSKLVKYLAFKKMCRRVPCGTATQIKTFVTKAGPAPAYMVDLPRSLGKDERMEDLFSALEEIKNGFISSPMYGEIHEMFMDPPHVIIMANFPPKLTLASDDRWKLWSISETLSLVALRRSAVVQ